MAEVLFRKLYYTKLTILTNENKRTPSLNRNSAVKQGQIVHKTATERQTVIETRVYIVTEIYRHRDREAHRQRDKATYRQTSKGGE